MLRFREDAALKRVLPPIYREQVECGKKNQLLARYNRLVNEWANAVTGLASLDYSRNSRHPEYPVRISAVLEAKDRARRAKHSYQEHTRNHGC